MFFCLFTCLFKVMNNGNLLSLSVPWNDHRPVFFGSYHPADSPVLLSSITCVCLYRKYKNGPCGAGGTSADCLPALWAAPSFFCPVSGLHSFPPPAPAAAKPHIIQGFLTSVPKFPPQWYEWLWIPSSLAVLLASRKRLLSFLLVKMWGIRELPRIQFFLYSCCLAL